MGCARNAQENAKTEFGQQSVAKEKLGVSVTRHVRQHKEKQCKPPLMAGSHFNCRPHEMMEKH